MGKVRYLHDKAMLHLQDAISFNFKEEFDKSRVEYEKAFDFENQASQLLETNDKTRVTKNILLRSAASLAFKCERIDECYKLIQECENNNPNARVKNECLELRGSIKNV